jgi:hypothetical protein
MVADSHGKNAGKETERRHDEGPVLIANGRLGADN